MKGDYSRISFKPENHYSAVQPQQGRPNTDADGLEQVEIESYLRQETLRDIVGISGAPAENPGFRLRRRRGNLIIGAGHYYVDGILCENEQNISFTEQPDLPGQVLPGTEDGTRRFLAYLDVWERHITAIEDPGIREVALGGPDTTTRKRTVCGVRLVEVAEDAHCLSALPGWEQAIAPGDGQLSARARPPEDTDNLCLVPPDAGFTGLENQLYRVEIHQGGEPREATCKWDRDNGSHARPIEEFLDGQPTDRIRLGGSGKSGLYSLKPGDLLEITDDIRELNGEPGLLLRVESNEPATGIVTLDEQVDGLSEDHHPKVRRWSGGAEITVSVGDFIPLENGIEVRFEGDRYRIGDYWLIPARTTTRNVEWPTQIQDDGEPEPLLLPPQGISHHYARLGLVDFADGDFEVVADCRKIFPALSRNTLKIERVRTAADSQVLPLFGTIRAGSLRAGLRIEFSAPLSEDAFNLLVREGQNINPAIEVKLDLPYPVTPEDLEFWGGVESFGFRPVTLASNISFVSDQRDSILWRPNEPARIWIGQVFSRLAPLGVDHILCTLRVRGDFIWVNDPNGGRVFLDGETVANPLRRAGLDFPSGNGQPGGLFSIAFWIVSEGVEVPLILSVNVRLNVVSGTVLRGGAPVESTTVTLRRTNGPGPGSEQTTQSDAAGQFSFTALEGDYTVIAEALGATVEQEVEVGPVIVAPGGGGGGVVLGGPDDLTVRRINGIGPQRAEILAANGVTRVAEFASLPPRRIARILPGVSEERAREMIANARELQEE